MPAVGKRSSPTANTSSTIRPSQNVGTDHSTSAVDVISRSNVLPCRHAARLPTHNPIATASTSAVPVSSTVGPSRPRIRSVTGCLNWYEVPRSPWSRSPM